MSPKGRDPLVNNWLQFIGPNEEIAFLNAIVLADGLYATRRRRQLAINRAGNHICGVIDA